MPKTIWKYEVGPGNTAIDIPTGAQFLSFQAQGDSCCVWFLVDSSADEHDTVVLEVYGTGHPIPDTQHAGNFLGTAMMHEGALVWHLFRESTKALDEVEDAN